MLSTSTKANADFVPSSLEELFQHYYPYVVNLVARLGIDQQNSEDVAMTVLTKFIEKDALSDFDPEFTTGHNGIIRKAVFRTFLSGFVKTYTMHHRTMQAKQLYREAISMDEEHAASEDRASTSTWAHIYGPSVEIDFDAFETHDLIVRIRTRLADEKARNQQTKVSMLVLFDTMLRHEYERGVVSPKHIAIDLGVSKQSVQTWIARLRPIVAEVMKS